MFLATIFIQQGFQVVVLQLRLPFKMLLLKQFDLTGHADRIESTLVAVLLTFALVFQHLVCLHHEHFLLHYFDGIARKLDPVVSFVDLFALWNVRVGILTHDPGLSIVSGRVGVQISQVLGDIFSLTEVLDGCLNLGISFCTLFRIG